MTTRRLTYRSDAGLIKWRMPDGSRRETTCTAAEYRALGPYGRPPRAPHRDAVYIEGGLRSMFNETTELQAGDWWEIAPGRVCLVTAVDPRTGDNDYRHYSIRDFEVRTGRLHVADPLPDGRRVTDGELEDAPTRG